MPQLGIEKAEHPLRPGDTSRTETRFIPLLTPPDSWLFSNPSTGFASLKKDRVNQRKMICGSNTIHRSKEFLVVETHGVGGDFTGHTCL